MHAVGPFGAELSQLAQRGNRRRLIVFVATFFAVLLAGQAWNYTRAPEYRTSLRLQLALPDAGGGRAASAAVATRLQLIDSRPLIERVAAKLGADVVGSGEDAVSRLKSMLEVRPVAGSEVVELRASGPRPRRWRRS